MPFFEALVGRFYAAVADDPILRPLYPEADLAPAQRRLTLFLAQYWGGPTTYDQERGHPRLRMRHAPFAIGTAGARSLARAHARLDRRFRRGPDDPRSPPRLHDDGRGGDAQPAIGDAWGYDGGRAPVAQWTERGRPKACVGGSSPSGGRSHNTDRRGRAGAIGCPGHALVGRVESLHEHRD